MCTALFLSRFLQILSDIFAVLLFCCHPSLPFFLFLSTAAQILLSSFVRLNLNKINIYNCIQRMHQNFISGRVLPPSAQRLDWGVSTLSLAFSFSTLNRGRVGNILYFAKGQIRCTCLCLKNMCANMRQHLD